MCQRKAFIWWKGHKRSKCPTPRCNQILREETGCPTHGWSFAGGRDKVIFANRGTSIFRRNITKIQEV